MEREPKLMTRAVTVQRVIATLALVVALGAVGSTFKSFGALGTVGCGAPILGSKVEHRAPTSSFLYGREAAVCARNGHSRLAIAGVVAVLALTLGVAGWARPLGLPWWLTGEDPPHLARRREDGPDAGRPGPDSSAVDEPSPAVRSSPAGPAKRAAAKAAPDPASAAPGEVAVPAKQRGRWVSLRDKASRPPGSSPVSDRRPPVRPDETTAEAGGRRDRLP